MLSTIEFPSFESKTPKVNFAFFSSLILGKFCSKKLCNKSVQTPSEMALICSKASLADLNGLNDCNEHTLPKRSMLL